MNIQYFLHNCVRTKYKLLFYFHTYDNDHNIIFSCIHQMEFNFSSIIKSKIAVLYLSIAFPLYNIIS